MAVMGVGRGGVLAVLAMALLMGMTPARACNCFSPELKAKTARETLAMARLAAFGQVVEARDDGSAVLVVSEVFKGAAVTQAIAIEPGEARCADKRPRRGDRLLLLAFDGPATACGLYDAENFLLQEFRALPGGAPIARP